MTDANHRPTMPDENELIPHKWVRIMADTSANGVWGRDGAPACADDLPIKPELIDRIRRWQAWYDRDENDWGLFKGDIEAFSIEGLAIARAVRAALPDWTVIYFDEAACYAADDSGAQTVLEYEV